MEVLDTITRLKAELDALRPIAPEQEQRIMQKFRLDWNYHSNHLEGNSLTYKETKALILNNRKAPGKPLKDHIEMTGHNEVLLLLEEVLKEERPLSEVLIRELHLLLLKKSHYKKAITPDGSPTRKLIHAGGYKQAPNHVQTVTGEMFYFATPEETPAKMMDLIDWYREKSVTKELHPLLLSATFHYKFVRIHPFDDGNGRMARILMNFTLMGHGYPPVIIKTEEKENYFLVLEQTDAILEQTNANLPEPFIEYIGKNLEQSLEIMIKGAKGESIEEADDVDKEIALLEHRLRMRKKTNDEEEGDILNARMHVFENTFIPLLEEYQRSTFKLLQSYKYSSISLPYPTIPNKNVEYRRVIQNRYEAPVRQRLTKYPAKHNRIIANFIFHNFDNKGIKPFVYTTKFTLRFSSTHYFIDISNGDSTKDAIEREYSNFLSLEEINVIARKAAKAHSDFIQQKLDAADQNT